MAVTRLFLQTSKIQLKYGTSGVFMCNELESSQEQSVQPIPKGMGSYELKKPWVRHTMLKQPDPLRVARNVTKRTTARTQTATVFVTAFQNKPGGTRVSHCPKSIKRSPACQNSCLQMFRMTITTSLSHCRATFASAEEE